MSVELPRPLHGFQESKDEAVAIVQASPYSYIAFAAPGSALSSAVWKVFRYDDSAGRLQYADGDQKYDNAADNLPSLTYS